MFHLDKCSGIEITKTAPVITRVTYRKKYVSKDSANMKEWSEEMYIYVKGGHSIAFDLIQKWDDYRVQLELPRGEGWLFKLIRTESAFK